MIEARDEGKILVESPEKVRKMSESQMPPADSFDELDDLEVDDDYQDSEQQAPTESIGDVFWDEYSRVWKAWKFVMRSWFSMPGKLSRIFIMELSRLWKYWLGDPVPPRSWEFRYPRHDEI
ncbi:endoplasmic oxidoreductin-1 [Cryomyces antarcticus]|uniref:Endoplasmic oxidoreductin-1 n=1 Tax=Cryomyces antarcticus TaxID=329879 RepID=A0ABR0LIG2_9PEZI|nr:endoplasmic oxidoreductin-1 [Cryomyces antarcticus]